MNQFPSLYIIELNLSEHDKYEFIFQDQKCRIELTQRGFYIAKLGNNGMLMSRDLYDIYWRLSDQARSWRTEASYTRL